MVSKDKRARGRHDRWSSEGAARRFTFAFMGTGVASDDATKMRRYTMGLTGHVYFGNVGFWTMSPPILLGIGLIMAKIHNPIRSQRLFVDSMKVGDVDILVERVPLEVFTGDAVQPDLAPLKPGQHITLRVSCDLVRGSR